MRYRRNKNVRTVHAMTACHMTLVIRYLSVFNECAYVSI